MAPTSPSSSSSGFTLLELLVVTLIVAVLAAIAAPGWLGFQKQQEIIAANEKAFSALRQGQTQAIQTRQGYRVSFRTDGEDLQYSIHPSNINDQTTAAWEVFAPHTELQYKWGTFKVLDPGEYWYVEFDFKGNVERVRVPGGSSLTGRVVFTQSTTSGLQRCVFISTIIGTMRIDSNEDCLSN